MAGRGRIPFLHITALTARCADACVLITCVTAACLAWQYPALPDLLPVHFAWNGRPNGWQYKTVLRVLMPALVQLTLLLSMAAVAALLVWRRRGTGDENKPDIAAAATAAEAIMSMAAIWVAFQAYAAFALVRVWHARASNLGAAYTGLEVVGVLMTIIVGVRAQRRLGHPPRPLYVAAHWRLGHLYCNADDPALFVPTRDGRRWTLNFGRPAAAILLGGILVVGILLPVTVLVAGLRGS